MKRGFNRSLFFIAIATIVSIGGWVWNASAAKGSGNMFAHMVYFTLNDPTPANKAALVAACNKYLTGHEGTFFYAAGTRAEDADREVNDKEFDVALQMVFDTRASQDKYQTHPRHLQFIEVAKPLYKSVRVFDANVASP